MGYKHCHIINADGYPVDFVLVVEGEIQHYTLKESETMIDSPVRDGLVKPRWNGSEWTESATVEEVAATRPTLEEVKATKKAEIAHARWQTETGGIEINGLTIVTDRESQALINAAVTSTIIDATYAVRWKTANGFVDLSAQMIRIVATAVRNHVQACFNREADIDVAIEAIATTDVSEYEAILKTITWEVN